MSKANRGKQSMIAVAFAVLVLVLLSLKIFMRSHLFDDGVALPSRISTVAEGYPVAFEMKNRIVPEANLVSVQIDLARLGDGFKPDVLKYLFVSRAGKGRSVMILIVNERGRAYVGMDRAEISRHPFFPNWELQPLALPKIDIPQVLAIANTNGLKEFGVRASGESGSFGLTLGSSTNVPFWLAVGSGWDDKEGVEGLHLEIDAQTGAVLSKSVEEAVRRQRLR